MPQPSDPINACAGQTAQGRGRVLLVSHNFPPTQGPESSLVKLNTLDLLRRGWQLSVLTTTMEHMHQGMDMGMLEGLPENLEIIRTPSYDAVIRRRWPGFAKLFLTVLRQWILPEIFILWLFSSFPAGKRWLQKNGPAILYSRATKHVSNITAWYLKRTTGLPWVAHFSDPWLGEPLTKFQIWLGRKIERRIFRDADVLVFVNPKLADYMLALYPWARGKSHVIAHGYAPLPHAPSESENAGRRALEVLHAGSFIPGYRDPGNLFSALALLNERRPLKGRLKLSCVGEDTVACQPEVDALGLQEIVTLLSSVPYQQCQDMIGRSDLLLVLDTPHLGGIYLPTKLIEYLPYEKPVIGLTEPDSAVHRVLQDCDLSFADQNDISQIARALEELLERWESGEWGVSSITRARVIEYRIDRVNERLDALLLSLQQRVTGITPS